MLDDMQCLCDQSLNESKKGTLLHSRYREDCLGSGRKLSEASKEAESVVWWGTLMSEPVAFQRLIACVTLVLSEQDVQSIPPRRLLIVTKRTRHWWGLTEGSACGQSCRNFPLRNDDSRSRAAAGKKV